MSEGLLAGDFMDRGDPDISWVVERFIARGTITTIWSTHGRGKTHALIRLVDAIAGNKDSFLGLPVKFHGPCLYVVAETPGLFKAALVSHPGGFPRDNVLIMPGWNLRTADGWLKFRAICRGAALVVLDPVTSLDWAVKISDNDLVNDIMRRFDRIAYETGAAIVLVLHRKKVTHAEAEYGSEEAEEASALGAIAWLAKAAGRFQLLKDRKYGLILKAWPSKVPTFAMLKLKTDKFGFHEIRNEWRPGSYVVDGEVVIPENASP
jgi:RecA-family ATPase